MRKIFIAATLALMAMPAMAANPFHTQKAQCFLQVDGIVHINDICEMTTDDFEKGYFQIGTGTGERFLARDEAGHDRHYGWFAQVTPNDDGTGLAYWNGEYGASHAMAELPPLHKQGACWVNGNTKVCAWKIGEKRNISSTNQAIIPEDDSVSDIDAEDIESVERDIKQSYDDNGQFSVKDIKLQKITSWAMSGVAHLINWHGGLEGVACQARKNQTTHKWNWECHQTPGLFHR